MLRLKRSSVGPANDAKRTKYNFSTVTEHVSTTIPRFYTQRQVNAEVARQVAIEVNKSKQQEAARVEYLQSQYAMNVQAMEESLAELHRVYSQPPDASYIS